MTDCSVVALLALESRCFRCLIADCNLRGNRAPCCAQLAEGRKKEHNISSLSLNFTESIHKQINPADSRRHSAPLVLLKPPPGVSHWMSLLTVALPVTFTQT
ncbi:hypothetical protein ATANTOWER_006728 [Ataeniobius toweri]|uniref:Secreted protein n=1 Tax=Ataeniobius toweri TaxID=208326 RepID=A0ABU7A4T6_9TELE|nr:hypothetical protein [Ataeniobius toweri]